MDSTLYRKKLTELLGELPEEERDDAVAFYLEAIADRIDEGMTESDAVASAPTPEEAAAAILLNAGESSIGTSQVACEGMQRIPHQLEDDAELVLSGEESSRIGAEGNAAENVKQPKSAMDPFATKPAAESFSSSQNSTLGAEAAGSAPAKPESFWRRLRKGRLTPMEWVGVVLASPVALCVAAVALGLAITVAALILMAALVAAALVLVAWILVLACWIVGISLTVASPACLLFVIWGLQVGDIPYALVQLGYGCFAFGTGIWALHGCKALTRWAWRVQQKGFAKLGDALRGARRKRRKGNSSNAACAGSSAESTVADAVGADGTRDVSASVIEEVAASDSTPAAFATTSDAAPDWGPAAAAASAASTRHLAARPSVFLRVCLGLVLAGLVLVFVGYAASGFNWRVFTSSFYDRGVLTLGGTVVDDPRKLLLGPLFYR